MSEPNTDKSLKQRLVRASNIVFISTVLIQVLSFGRAVAMARLLTPADFGLVGASFLWVTLMLVITEMGLTQGAIHFQLTEEEEWATVWWMSALRGMGVFGLLFLLAPVAGIFFRTEGLTPILRVLSATVLISGMQSVGLMKWHKEMQFTQLKTVLLIGEIGALFVGVGTAWWTRSAWSLVWASLARSSIVFVLSYLLHPFRPRLMFHVPTGRKMLGYSLNTLGGAALSYVNTEGDDALVGRLRGIEPLAEYKLAYRLSNLPATMISHVLAQVTLPAYATLQTEMPRLRKMYLEVLQLAGLLVFPFTITIAVFASEIILLTYGEKWIAAASAVVFLAFFGLVRVIGGLSPPLFMSIGKPRIVVKLQLLQLAVIAAVIYPLTMQYGIAGTAVAVLAGAASNQLFVAGFLRTEIGISFRSYARVLLPFAIAGVAQCVVAIALKAVLGDSRWLRLTVGGATALLCYLAVLRVLLPRQFRHWMARARHYLHHAF